MKSIRFFLSLTLILTLVYSDYAFAASLIGSPTSNNRETSPFGWRESTKSNHLGVDYGAVKKGVGGDSTYSTVSGKVVESRYQTNTSHSGGWGNTVLIESDSGNYRVRYSHLDAAGLGTGTRVSPGDVVGKMGGTGKAGGYAVHLDYAVYVKNPATGKFQAVDPNMAAGKNLDDPAVAAALIADAEGKIAGKLRNEGAAKGGAGGEVTVDNSGGSDAIPIGCDPEILKGGQAKVDALNTRDADVANAIIKQPTDIGQMTCVDQHIKLQNEANKISTDGISAEMTSLVEAPAVKWITSNFMDSQLAGSIGSMVNDVYSGIVSEFGGAIDAIGSVGSSIGSIGSSLGGLFGGGSAGYDCDMMEQSWLLSQCIDLPKIPSLEELTNRVLGGVVDAAADLINAPFEALDAACKKVSGTLGDYAKKTTNVFEDAADEMTKPITDGFESISTDIKSIPGAILD